MGFLSEPDYLAQIKQDVLDEVVDEDATLIGKAERSAQKRMVSFLKAKYNTTEIFSRTGDNRDDLIVEMMVDLVLYRLHSRINPHSIPDLREKRYNQAIAWLKDVANSVIDADLPRLENEDGVIATNSRFGTTGRLTEQW